MKVEDRIMMLTLIKEKLTFGLIDIGYQIMLQGWNINGGCWLEYIEQLQNSLTMEKHSWKAVRYNDKAGHLPTLRWGHSCALIEDQAVFFGGYADSTYMNDIWSFNTITMEWNEIQTTGDIPSHRSNCTMHYDSDNDRLIVFGGGGANKLRYDTISILNWKNKEWTEYSPKPNQPAPWARTYHSAELFYPFLVIFGGEGITDLDDLWIFNFDTMGWKEVPILPNAVRPCARRFHSSARVGNQFFVIAGCHSKYRCLSDIYSIDLTFFFESGSVQGLLWRQRKMRDNTFLTRWGHTSVVFDEKIYVFGGRFCNDLNDILVLDPGKDQITTLKIQGEIPKARRRHSACFLGNSMLIFGGFNGQYFNDLHYVSIGASKKKLGVRSVMNRYQIQKLKDIKGLQWITIKSKQGCQVSICKGLMAPRFRNQQNLSAFLKDIDQTLPEGQLQQIIMNLYKGYGKMDSHLIYHYGMLMFQSKEEMELETKKTIGQEQRQSIIGNKRLKAVEPVVIVSDFIFREYLEKTHNEEQYYDVIFSIKGESFVKANRALLAMSSQYFKALVSKQFKESQDVISVPFTDPVLFELVINYLSTGFLVVSKDYGHQFWVMLAEIAQYCSLTHLLSICEQQLMARISEMTCQQLLVIALQMSMEQLARSCAQQIIRNMINQEKQQAGDVFPDVKSESISFQRQQVLKEVYSLLRFDILQKKIDSQQKQIKNSLKSIQSANYQNQQDYKQNNQTKN